jgi:polyhydroxyalkanoate synthase
VRFVLAGSGHIAGVVNPPAAGKYQYWIGGPTDSLDAFIAGAEDRPGSWWTDWIGWLRELDPKTVEVSGKRSLAEPADAALEDAPGRYVAMR